ncbi:hypothetical protein SAMN05421839_1074 [Halolactibacillus halophilus]|uniref:Uncharacterized protein n=1 Tax=Halolactibacillus halophilus TaxID=306540 RepID=A0A1I5MYQ6_9BACI|nr:hypothetical protein [Halolactibacillus halophilus]GEM01133.1 hypothetical protein HHA03_06650 [Halolactibacillus halophilus]SFP14552.1 hypothetical protein SAMN05421839_1074 [Halolactibacillus halophilus]
MKKVLIVALSVIMFLTVSTTSVFAQTGSSSLKDNKVELGQELVIDESTEGISDVLTYEELVSEVANDQNISKEQARNELTSSLYGTSGKVVNKSSVAAAATATYRTISTSVSVTSTYKPQIRYYCQTDERGGSFRAIKKILKVSLNRSYNGK